MIKKPHAPETELSVIGGIAYEGNRMMQILTRHKITSEHFHDPRLAKIYDDALELFTAGKPIDATNVTSDVALLEKCIEKHESIAHAEYNCEVLHAFYQRRGIIDVCRELAASAVNEEVDAEQLRSKAELEISRLALKKESMRRPGEILDQVASDWQLCRDKGSCIGVQTGFRALDVFFGGLMKSAFYIFSGQAGACKTTLARNIMEFVAERGDPVSMLSLEQTVEQIWGGIAARFAKQSPFLLNCGSKKASVECIRNVRSFVSELPISVEERPHTISECISWGRREVSRGSKLLVVDYIQRLMGDPGVRYGTEEEKIATSSTALANLAKETGIPVLAIAAENRAGELRGSGILDYDAYCKLRLAKAEDWTPQNLVYEASFTKQRFGPQAEPQRMVLLDMENRLVDESEYFAMKTAAKETNW